jgi:hypothetical protein
LWHLEAGDDRAEMICSRGAGLGGYQVDEDGSESIHLIGRFTEGHLIQTDLKTARSS